MLQLKTKEWTDYEIIAACRLGDEDGFAQLMRKYERLIYSIPLNYGLSRADAADIAQVTLTIFLQRMDSLHDDSQLGAWLATVARRHCWRLMEQRSREQIAPEEDLAEQEQLVGEHQPDFHSWEGLERLNEGLSRLGEKCRGLLQALYLEAETPSYEEISERFQMRVGSIGPTRARCLLKLRDLIGDW